MRNSLLIVATSLLLTGCAAVSKQQCQSGDWLTIGYNDAIRGFPPTQIENNRLACDNHDVVPDVVAWQEGYALGAASYCTIARGHSEGLAGAEYRGVCPSEIAEPFLSAYLAGLRSAQSRLFGFAFSHFRHSGEPEHIRNARRRLQLMILRTEEQLRRLREN